MAVHERIWLPSPPDEGWTPADVDALPDIRPFRVEIIDGVLIVSPSAHPWHFDVAAEVRNALVAAAPAGQWAYNEVEIKRIEDNHVRHSLKPDVLVAPRALREPDKPPYAVPEDVLLVVEVVAPSSVWQDRLVKPLMYSDMGIGAMWRIERGVTLTEYRLTPRGSAEIVQEVAGGTFHTHVPFPVTIDLDGLR